MTKEILWFGLVIFIATILGNLVGAVLVEVIKKL